MFFLINDFFSIIGFECVVCFLIDKVRIGGRGALCVTEETGR